jgi:nucleoside-diphosphate-sugar epimerase
MAKYFVTGATGFIGGEIVKQLVGRGHKVVALVRSPDKAAMLRALGVEIHAGDITNRETLKAPMTGVDGVFHVAAWYKVGVKEPHADQINVDGTRNVLKTMCALEIPRGVYTSTLAVFSDTHGVVPDESYRYEGPHLSEYDRTKWIAHYRVALPKIEQGLPVSIVMPGVVYGPGDTSGMHTALVDLLRGRLPMTPAKTAFCWAHVEDTARAHILAMERGRPGETYIIAGPRHTFEYAFDLAASIARVRAPVFHPGPHAMRAMAAVTSAVGHVVNLPPSFTPEAFRVLAGTTYFGSNDKAVRELGFSPRSLEEGMAQTLEHELRLLGRA